MSLSSVFSLLAISQLIALGLGFSLHYRSPIGKLFLLLCFCMIGHLATEFEYLTRIALINNVMLTGASLIAFLLFLISHSLFVDQTRIGLHNWLLAAFYIPVRTIGRLFYDPGMDNSEVYFIVIYVIPQIIQLYFSILSIYIAVKGFKSDLIEHRRSFRFIFVLSLGLYLFFRIGNGFFSFQDPFLSSFAIFSLQPLPNSVFAIYAFIVLLLFDVLVFRVQDGFIGLLSNSPNGFPGDKQFPISQAGSGNQSKLVVQILDFMENQKLYTQHGFTIAELASKLHIAEHKLRKVINKELHFRNFNQFLNNYRIRDASQRLLESDARISTIALEVGFSSLSSFNSVFKSHHGLTPSEYRSQHRPNSTDS